MSSFIWNNKTPQICMSVLHLPYESGGLKLPNFYYYFLSSQLTQFKQWFMNISCSWKIIESFDMYPYSLEHLPYIEFKAVDKITKNPVILNSLSIWKLYHKLLSYKISLFSFFSNLEEPKYYMLYG